MCVCLRLYVSFFSFCIFVFVCVLSCFELLESCGTKLNFGVLVVKSIKRGVC